MLPPEEHTLQLVRGRGGKFADPSEEIFELAELYRAPPTDQWIASLLAIIPASILLCCFSKGAYGAAAVLFVLALIFDIIAVEFW